MAANLKIFQEPQCLIESDPMGKLQVVRSTLGDLEQLDRPLVVVAIAGLYRTGKSYLMNRLAGTTKGFALGSTIQSKTKGIWVWARPHPHNPEHYLVLLDTEGLGDAEKGNQNHDNWIFCLATLLSSTLVYNALNAINDDSLAKLNFITEMSKHIKTRSTDGKENDQNFDWYFPMFIYVLRDFTLELEIDGKEVDADAYLENCLALKPEKDDKDGRAKKFNLPRKCIRKYFKKRKCFTFDRPAGRKLLKSLDSLTDKDLSQDFVEEVTEFCDYVFGNCGLKRLENGKDINGRMLCALISTYVDAIRDGAVPCIENAVTSMAVIENSRATEEAVVLYRDRMLQTLYLPTPTDKILADTHFECLKEAVAYFLKKSVFDDDNTFQNTLNEKLKSEYENFVTSNENASTEKCRSLLMELNQVIDRNLKSGAYAVSGGYQKYQRDLQDIQTKYQQRNDLGGKMKDTLLIFLQEKWIEGEGIMAADQQVTKQEKAAEEERQKALEMQRKKEMAEREAELERQHAEERERAMKENIEQMEKQRDQEIKALQEHYDKVMNERIAEQARLLKEAHEKEAARQAQEIEELKKQMQQRPKRRRGKCSIM